MMGQGEVCLEIVSNLVGVRIALPDFSIVQGHSGCKEELKGGDDNLDGRIGSTSGGGLVEGIVELVEEAFGQLIGIVGGLESNVVILEVVCQDAIVLGI